MAQTALVTGASSGIGEQFARRLAGRGYELVLVARRADRLEALAAELPVTARVVACDLASDAAELPGRVAELGIEVDLLVNNAGFGSYGRVWEIEEGRDAAMVRVNCEAIVVLSRAFVPAMVERGRGGVITVASTSGYQPLPWNATYAATKAFAIRFSEALAEELRGTGVRALVVNPGPVPTEFSAVAGVETERVVPGKIAAEQVVDEALDAWDRDRRNVIPGRLIKAFMAVSRPTPRSIQLRVTERLYRRAGRDSTA